MGMQVISGAVLKCSCAVPPGITSLTVTPVANVTASGPQAANIMDCVPIANIPSFGMCVSPINPQFISATAAASGVPTPVPCSPITVPWAPGCPTVHVRGFPSLNNSSKCACAWGMISVTFAGQLTVQIP